jgi:uncharacterized protein (DUF58 family)
MAEPPGRDQHGAPSARGTVDTAALMKIRSLELRAKVVVEGFQRGIHRSPFHGFSVEFTEYRSYVPGDDVRFLDWRLYARTDRDYVKKFEDETNLRCHLVVDQSGSMGYGSRGHDKAAYAATLAATLAHFLDAQGDAVGLVTFADRLTEHIPARHRPGHLRRLLLALDRAPAGPSETLGKPLAAVAGVLPRRGLVVLVSDLLAPAGDLERQLGALASSGHEVVVFQVLDPEEMTFTFADVRGAPAVFRDLESGRRVLVEPAAARGAYRKALAAHLAAIDTSCRRFGIERLLFTTDQPLDLALLAFLGAHDRRVRRGRAA